MKVLVSTIGRQYTAYFVWFLSISKSTQNTVPIHDFWQDKKKIISNNSQYHLLIFWHLEKITLTRAKICRTPRRAYPMRASFSCDIFLHAPKLAVPAYLFEDEDDDRAQRVAVPGQHGPTSRELPYLQTQGGFVAVQVRAATRVHCPEKAPP